MKKAISILLILGFVLVACTSTSQTTITGSILIVGEGENQKQYTVEDLKALPQTESEFNGTSYIGVSLAELLTDSGYDVQNLTAVKVVASDGYSVLYEPALFLREDVILAHTPLTAEDGAFRMVLSGEEGKLNVRMVTEVLTVPQ